MRLGPTQIINCPGCKTEYNRNSIRSMNSFGAKWYSDGWIVGGGYDQSSPFCKCVSCGIFFLHYEQPVIGEEEFEWEETPEGRIIFLSPKRRPYVKRIPKEEYPLLLSDQTISSTHEKQIRIEYMWALNDGIRETPTQNFVGNDEEIFKDNAMKLEKLLSDSDPDNIRRAELNRRLGRFELALAALENISDTRYASFIDLQRKACHDSNDRLLVLE